MNNLQNIYNSVTCTLYDGTKSDTSVQFSYIFDGKGATSSTRLFYFSYQVLSNAEVGDAYFDITIGEAYDNALNDVSVSGSRCKFTIAETVTSKTCTVSGSSTISTSVNKEFSLSYRFSTYQLASGTVIINYDSELFEPVEVTQGGFLTSKVTDINSDLPGAVYISFVGTKYETKYDVVVVKFRTLKNVDETSNITYKVTELYDLNLDPVSCKEYITTTTIVYDNLYVGDSPKMSVDATYDTNTKKVTARIFLEENSNLGAGDFILHFNQEILTLSSYEKGFSPSFFNINEKEVAEGKLKFSIISLEDVVTNETILTLEFDVREADIEQQASFSISGSMLSDALTNPIQLNFVGDIITIPVHKAVSEIMRKGQTLEYKNLIYVKVIYDLINIDLSTVDLSKDAGMLYWTADEFAQLSGTPSIDNVGAGTKVEIESYGSTNMWCAVAPAVAAKDMKETVYYVLGYIKHQDGTISYSGITSYSFEQYIYNKVADTTASQEMQEFAKRLYVYERAANEALK